MHKKTRIASLRRGFEFLQEPKQGKGPNHAPDDLPAVSRRIGLVHMATLRGMWSAMKNGEATIVVLFPARIQQEKTPTNKKAKNLDDVAETKVTNGARNVALDNAYQHGFVWPYQA